MTGPAIDPWDRPADPDVFAEKSILGACMLSADRVEEVLGILEVKDFSEVHRTIFRALVELDFAGLPTDVITLKNHMEQNGTISELKPYGGPIYLHTLQEAFPIGAQVATHAKIVAEIAERNRVWKELVKANQKLRSPDRPTAEVVNDLSAGLDSVRRASLNGGRPGQSWRPVDLGPILRGEKTRAFPSIGLARSDGLRLLYPGKEHTVIGEMESGKSWFCTACCAAELTAGNYVLYLHFEETDPTDTVERLQTLGVPDDDILKRFRFVGPEEPLRPALLAALLDPRPTLVVLDGVNEAMALHGQAIREEDGAAAFRRYLVKPFTAVGAATLGADHVVKDRERRDRGPLGSVHKGNAVNGAMILLENAEPFGRGQRGRSHVFITKDRPGHLRGNGRPDSKTPGKTFLGELVVDDTRTQHSYLELSFWAPTQQQEDQEPADPRAEVDADVFAVVQKVIASGSDPNVTNIRANSPYGNTKTADSLARLVMDGRLALTPGAKRAQLYMPSGSGSPASQDQIPGP